jgi:hypothetical protein
MLGPTKPRRLDQPMADTLEAMNPQYPPAEAGLEAIVIPD